MRLDRFVRIIKFSKDSKTLYCGDGEGYLKVYEITNNFKLIY